MNNWTRLLSLFLLAVGFRVLNYLAFQNELVVGPDQMQEISLARKFAAGDTYGLLDTYWAPFYPFLIGIFSLVIDSVILPALAVSIVAGGLLAPLTFLLARQFFQDREAWIAAILAIFYPHLVNSVIALGSENVFIALVIGALIAGWESMRRDSALFGALTGAIVGLAYLTRPEAIGYVLFFVFGFVLYDVLSKRAFGLKTLTKYAGLVVLFGLLATPYILYLKAEAGVWSVSGKTRINTIAAQIVEEAPDGAGASPSPQAAAREFLKWFGFNLFDSHKTLPILVPPFLLMLVGSGFFAYSWDRARAAREIYLLLFCAVTVAGYSAAVVQMRYFYVLLPIFFVWIAAGILSLVDWSKSMLPARIGNRKAFQTISVSFVLFLVYLYCVPLNFWARSAEAALSTRAYEERDAGLWLRANGKPAARIYTTTRRPAFYADGESIAPTSKDHATILEEIRARKAEYVVVSERSFKRNPYFRGIDERLTSDAGFELVYSDTKWSGYSIFIFEVR